MEKYYIVLRTGRDTGPELVYIAGDQEVSKLTRFEDTAQRVANQLTKVYGSAFKYEVCELKPI